MNKYIADLLVCPVCHGRFEWKITREINTKIEEASATCRDCGSSYPILDGIGIFLTPDLPRNDLWEQSESQLEAYLQEHPDLEARLMESPIQDLSSTDQQFRALVLDERGKFERGRRVEELAHQTLYGPEYRTCWENQIEYTLETLTSFAGPILDLASGRGYLAEKIAGRLRRPIIASDFSPRVLRRDRRYFQYLGLDELTSLLAFDARKTPFGDDSMQIMTTNLGFSNIENPGELMGELRRISCGVLLAISQFFPVEDGLNRDAIIQAGLENSVYKVKALEEYKKAGWTIRVENACLAVAQPTPESDLFDGARADGLPVAPTTLEFCTIRAT